MEKYCRCAQLPQLQCVALILVYEQAFTLLQEIFFASPLHKIPTEQKFLAVCSANEQVLNVPRDHWESWYVILSCNYCSILLMFMFRSAWFSGVLFFKIEHGPPLLEAATLWSLVNAWMQGLSANGFHDSLHRKLSSAEEEQRGYNSIMHLMVQTLLWTYLLCDDRSRPNGWLAPVEPCSRCRKTGRWEITYPKRHILLRLLAGDNPPQAQDYTSSSRPSELDFDQRSGDFASYACWMCKCGTIALSPLRALSRARGKPNMLSEFRRSVVVVKKGKFRIFMGRGVSKGKGH